MAQQQPSQDTHRHGSPHGAAAPQVSVTPSAYECGICEQPIEGVVYFASGYYNRPACGDCARLAKWQRLVDWYAKFRPDEELPARDADVAALQLPPTRECEVCGREIAWLVWRQSKLIVCSYACRNERDNARRRVIPQQKFCLACGQPFVPKRSDAVTCTDRCRQAKRRMGVVTDSHTFKRDHPSQIDKDRARAAGNRDTKGVA